MRKVFMLDVISPSRTLSVEVMGKMPVVPVADYYSLIVGNLGSCCGKIKKSELERK